MPKHSSEYKRSKPKKKKKYKKIEPLKEGEGLQKLQFDINKDIETNKKINPKKIFEDYNK
tara:strand:- start:28 stop:207 length:180 start_codon:yes stop_codon:yes gene_type:complete